ncbi:hypothetical protein K661_03233 [Piscirickettsia salmonis LF-89 = ATCC VR-1361]|nr:hypothetical protein K661_03233 [Piscirickettsia salmonis LF-89 = ATCC VR-1361]
MDNGEPQNMEGEARFRICWIDRMPSMVGVLAQNMAKGPSLPVGYLDFVLDPQKEVLMHW